MAPAQKKKKEPLLVSKVKKPAKWNEPSDKVLATFKEISARDPMFQQNVQALDKNQRKEWTEKLVKAVFTSVKRDPVKHSEAFEACIKKCDATLVLDAINWSKWGGAKDVKAKLIIVDENSEFSGNLSILPAPNLITTVIVVYLRGIKPQGVNASTYYLANLFQFNFMGFAIDYWTSTQSYIQTDIAYKWNPSAKQPKPTDAQKAHRAAQQKAKPKRQIKQKTPQTAPTEDDDGSSIVSLGKPSSEAVSLDDDHRSVSTDKSDPVVANFRPVYTTRTITREEATLILANPLKQLTDWDCEAQFTQEQMDEMNQQVESVLNEHIVQVLSKEDRKTLVLWAAQNNNVDVGVVKGWLRAAGPEDKEIHEWMEISYKEITPEVKVKAENLDLQQALTQADLAKLIESNNRLTEMVQGLSQDMKDMTNASKNHSKMVSANFASLTTQINGVKRKFDEQFANLSSTPFMDSIIHRDQTAEISNPSTIMPLEKDAVQRVEDKKDAVQKPEAEIADAEEPAEKVDAEKVAGLA